MNIIQATRRAISREALVVKKNSPHILFVAGVGGVIGATVLACKATLKLEKTLEECKERILDAKHPYTDGTVEMQNNREIALAYVSNSLTIARLYAPAAGVMFLSIGALVGSHATLSKRNAALMSAYATLQTAFEAYRDRVREQLGNEKELELYRGIRKELGEDGLTEIDVVDPNKTSAYARCFDEYSKEWTKDPELNKFRLQCLQQHANDLLQARGHVFLNEVYDMLGMDRIPEGQVVGWLRNKDGTNYIDFGIFAERNSPFVAGWERNVWLDFNVEGVIYARI